MANKMRLSYYIYGSIGATALVIFDAFNRRPNFYAATVFLAQSPLSFMILANFTFLCYSSIIYGIQRLLFGDLRIIERERLWERGWISVTETLLIMMTFSRDVGGWFLFILANLVVARMWAWLIEGRIEMLEQQPPANPRLFHARLSASLLVCCLCNFGFLKYCVDTVLEQAKPGMMVMFAFEFAVLTITSFSNLFRYTISLYEIRVVRQQTKAKIEERRAELRTERAALEARVAEARAVENAEAASEATDSLNRLSRDEENIDENDIDVPGWEDKGRWVFGLDILTDFLRLIVYLAFFSVLMIFHGIPIHIVRDVYVTLHSFLKRIYSYWQYRTATKDMDTRFPDATAEELERENTCIVCREEMAPWPAAGQPPMEQRLRAKKLPCGHVLHFGCLRSWLERQQVCPTCRRPVLDAPGVANTHGANNAAAAARHPALLDGAPAQAPAVPAAQPHGDQQRPNNPPAAAPAQGQNPLEPWRPRVLNLGPLRIAFGNIPANTMNMIQRGQLPIPDGGALGLPGAADQANSSSIAPGPPQGSPAAIEYELLQIERELSRQIMELNVQQQQLTLVRTLQNELARLRASHAQAQAVFQTPIQPPSAGASAGPSNTVSSADSGSQNQLPSGMTLPEGWTLLPLTRTDVPPREEVAFPTTVSSTSGRAAPVLDTSAALASLGQARTLRPTPTTTVSDSSSTAEQPPAESASRSAVAPSVSSPKVASNTSDQPSTTQEQRPDAAMNGTQLPPKPASATSSTPSVTAPMPTWSFDNSAAKPATPTASAATSSSHSDEPEETPAERTNGSANGTLDKGKGRAVTIEDEPELD